MKIIGLLRHAKSEDHQPSGRDFDRGLNAKGRRAATVMGAHIGARAPAFDRILASPAQRVRETLDLALDAMGRRAPVDRAEDRRLYLATSEVIAEVAAEMGGSCDSLLIVSHNPGLEDFVLDHVPDDAGNAMRDTVAVKYPTGAFAVLEFDIDDWADLPDAKGRIVALTRPRDLDPALGPDLN
ncbi:histidine phosphatase family protein [Croceicoccus sp. YJ47]|uniref:SixA phosphatase family protein n=1 Tax=Croceicoccus sp. YJ47 TaxID=2798724 RepID=UPI001922B9DA|nr:histidine phosphatase family protein [Croceicoccus sp. YJ47]QQN74608.1 histidine phosphatase family protein [Croceicoccus sp. YJ47]